MAFFLYAAFLASLTQFVILPFFLPEYQASQGIFRGIDTGSFHAHAHNLADAIVQHGWSVWEPAPGQQLPIGILSALYAFFGPNFHLVIPINAFLHATSGVLLFLIFYQIISEKFLALVASLPFVLFPVSALWVTQFHKEGIFIFGIYIFTFFITTCISPSRKKYQYLLASLPGGFGLGVVWSVRPYFIKALTVVLCLFSISRLIHAIVRKDILVLKSAGVLSGAFAISLLLIDARSITHVYWQLTGDHYSKKRSVAEQTVAQDTKPRQKFETLPHKGDVSRPGNGFDVTLLGLNIGATIKHLVDLAIGYRRSFSGYRKATTDLDAGYVPKNFSEIALFLPKAFLNGIFAPYPSQWLQEGRNPVRTVLKKVVMFEMLFIYGSIAFLLMFAMKNRRNTVLTYVLSFCLFITTLQGFIISNAGTLHRMRYGFIMLIVGFGIIQFCREVLTSNEKGVDSNRESARGWMTKFSKINSINDH